MTILFFWLIFVLCVSALAIRRNRSVVGWTLGAIILTPLIGLILACLPTLPAKVKAVPPDSDELLLTVEAERKEPKL